MNFDSLKQGSKVIGICLLFLVAVGLWFFNRQDRFDSERSYASAQSLLSACNLKQTERLEVLGSEIDSAVADGTLSDSDAQRLSAIMKQAQAGQWAKAQGAVRALLVQQVQPNDLPNL